MTFCIILPIFSYLSNETPKPNKTPKSPVGWAFLKNLGFLNPELQW